MLYASSKQVHESNNITGTHRGNEKESIGVISPELKGHLKVLLEGP